MIETSPQPEIDIHEIEEVDLKSVFSWEARTFTPWLSRPENLARLARSLGIEIEPEAIEANSGTFRTDILARNLADGTIVVIENQFGRSDHDHFGKAMTCLAAHGAKTVVWIAEAFVDEHRAALTWLNDNTPEDVSFYGVVPRLMRIAGSPPGLRIEVVIAPNAFVKQQKQEDRKIDSEIANLRERFWRGFDQALDAEDGFSGCRRRYGGRLGLQWILPDVGDEWTAEESHVLVFVQAGKDATASGLASSAARAPARRQRNEMNSPARHCVRGVSCSAARRRIWPTQPPRRQQSQNCSEERRWPLRNLLELLPDHADRRLSRSRCR